ncbi:hypothetical protein C3F09_00615 [candidate division GN15 bacterium]|uniref:Uncharacterized protein n=1 Tax=candidate division GN15 bacterium TaxID=2072418 RepID=A0A855XC46_9BACT|nr:MAG: hypothetical protein C3F09_00615 [candidate division GN15 bacterium]
MWNQFICREITYRIYIFALMVKEFHVGHRIRLVCSRQNHGMQGLWQHSEGDLDKQLQWKPRIELLGE